METRAYVIHIGETVLLFSCVSDRVYFTRKLKTRFPFLLLPADRNRSPDRQAELLQIVGRAGHYTKILSGSSTDPKTRDDSDHGFFEVLLNVRRYTVSLTRPVRGRRANERMHVANVAEVMREK